MTTGNERLILVPPLVPPLLTNGARSIATNRKTPKPLKNMPIDALQGLAMAGKIPPTGIEPVA